MGQWRQGAYCKMIKAIVFSVMLLPALSPAMTHPCVVIGRSVDMSLVNAMRNDMGIGMKELDMDRTTLELLGQYPLDATFSGWLADKGPTEFVKRKDLLAIYTQDNPVNLIVKHTYFNHKNHKNHKNIFIGSHIVNDDECSVKFTGYIVVKREF